MNSPPLCSGSTHSVVQSAGNQVAVIGSCNKVNPKCVFYTIKIQKLIGCNKAYVGQRTWLANLPLLEFARLLLLQLPDLFSWLCGHE
jgi:hypothetical protein